jgi:alginate O-acetyltransferase complex protein AlgI
LFVAFFPQLVAGPIVRFSDFEPQLETPRRPTWANIAPGLALLVWGLFEKIVLADGLFAPVADAAWASSAPSNAATAWSGAIAFAGQIFCDFAGYSCCAIGAARCLGFTLPDNFRNPYAAGSFSDFWRRWHVSLSTWLRDYLYLSLGGNRGSRARTYRNLMLTMLLGGLWHGAAWTFVVWGGLHGSYLVIERVLRDRAGFEPERGGAAMRIAWAGLVLLLVVITWIPFRSPDLAYSIDFLSAMLVFPGTSPSVDQGFALIAFGLMVALQWIVRDRRIEQVVERLPAIALGTLLAVVLASIVLSPGETHAFIYFQF